MAKVIFSMTAGVPHGDDYVQPTGDTPISLGEVEGKSYFSIDDGNTTIKTDGANGLKLSRYLTFKFKFFCISSDLGSPKIDLPPKALGPNSILP